ncbi:MAG TPA: D-glycero-D-manno-heptose 1-phosphate guanosyltransferase [Gammaproteobacteria bacterium]|nr:D-glycero-D-manno-heptose 1-phosphate guanosyltransferase [Gammaproteobacteria bacterium]
MRAIVLAGGLGTRLARVTRDIPKPMAPVGSRPFLEYLLDDLVEQGVEQTVLAVSYRWEVIREHFGLVYRGMELGYSVEENPLGTGGAIRQALESLTDDEVIVLNGDTRFRVGLVEMEKNHRDGGAQLTIALKWVANSGRFGRVEVSADGVVTSFLEKSTTGPGWINGGVYILNNSLFRDFPMPEKFSFELDLVEPNIDRIQPRAFQSDAYFIDMGIPEDYQRAQREIGVE